MTNAEFLDKIKSEIGRLHAQHSSKYETDEAGLVLERLEDFISTLEEPSGDDLEKEVKKYISKDTPELWTGDDDYEYTSVPLCWMYDFARHFAEWGAEHSCRSEMLKGLEETADEWYEKCQFLKSVWWNEEGKTKLIDAWESFIAGVKWQEEREPLPEDTVLWDDGFKTGREVGAREQKERMMNEAIEATLDNTAYPTRLWFNTYLSEYSNNDKVRVIIVKED